MNIISTVRGLLWRAVPTTAQAEADIALAVQVWAVARSMLTVAGDVALVADPPLGAALLLALGAGNALAATLADVGVALAAKGTPASKLQAVALQAIVQAAPLVGFHARTATTA